MSLVRLIYTSTISDEFRLTDLKPILESANRNNKSRQVTGLLSFNRKYFLQCLEGDRTVVNRLYQDITYDPRHENFLLLDYREVAMREFSSWSMGYLEDSDFMASIALKYSASSLLNPYELSAEAAHHLILAIRDHLTSKQS